MRAAIVMSFVVIGGGRVSLSESCQRDVVHIGWFVLRADNARGAANVAILYVCPNGRG